MAYNSNFKKKIFFDDQKQKLPGTAPNPYGGWAYYRCTPQKNFRSHILVIAEIWLPSLSPVLWFRYCIRQLREFYYFKSIEDLFSNARRRFLDSIMYHKNETLRFLSQLLRETEEMERSKTPWFLFIYFFPIARLLP